MDVLDNYKKAWENQPEDTQKVSKLDIYKLTQKKSTSIVKWIFIIGIIEFIVLNSSYFFLDMDKANEEYQKIGIHNIVFYSQIVMYIAVFYFLVKFYLNYRNISVTDNTKELMQKIIKTRKTVRNYVLLNLAFLLFIMVVTSTAIINTDANLNSSSKIALFIGTMIIVCIVFLVIFWLFYQLLYGILLRKLNRNYKELAKLDQ